MMARFALLLLLLSIYIPHAICSVCGGYSFRGRYRDADVVLKARVVSVRKIGKNLIYIFQLLDVFKGCPPRVTFFARSDGDRSLTSRTVIRPEGMVYVLNLQMKKGTGKMPFELGFCEGHPPFGTLSTAQKRFLKNQSMKKKNMCMK